MRAIKIICAILLPSFCLAQAVTFKKYELPNVGYISIPDNMEMQSSKNKEEVGELLKRAVGSESLSLDNNRVVFQQKGVNNLDKSAFSPYAYVRVIIETNIGNYGDYEKLTTDYTATQAEISGLNKEFKSQVQQSLKIIDQKLITWYGTSITKVNGRTAIKFSYLRQLNDNPYVVVNIYVFQNNDRVHRLTLSYRQTEEATWKSLFSKVLNSFTITNVR